MAWGDDHCPAYPLKGGVLLSKSLLRAASGIVLEPKGGNAAAAVMEKQMLILMQKPAWLCEQVFIDMKS